MNKVTVSAPGKLMLMGEHAVVYGYPCLVVSINKRMVVEVKKLKTNKLNLSAKDLGFCNYQKHIKNIGKGEIPKEAKFIEYAVQNFFQKYKVKSGLKVTTSCGFSQNYGFGSSSAVVVCTMKALSEIFQKNMTKKEMFELCLKTVVDIQKIGSGFDVASSIYGGVISFQKPDKIETFRLVDIPLIVGFTGKKADTVEMVNLVKMKVESHKEATTKAFEKISEFVRMAKKAYLDQDWVRFGVLFDFNQDYLESLGVSSENLNVMIQAARKAGALGAKLSGAGGGDCIIALSAKKRRKDVRKAITDVGGIIVDIKIEEKGVRIEK